jgi:hypothetical protein
LTSLLVFYLSEKRSRHSPTLTNLAVNTSNRITLAGFTYDAAGNETTDVTNTYVWNAESEIKTGGGVNYTYDGDGDRVQKSNGKIYWFGAGSQVLDESDASGNVTDEYIYFGGKRIAHQVVSTNTLTKDQTATGPKAAEATGQTAGGQATDKYGNKLGPSKKPQVNQTDHSTEKAAKDAARQQGKRTLDKHPRPQKGDPHYHPTDKDGKKIPNSTHHNYPD